MFPTPWLGDSCLAVVPHGGAVVLCSRKYRPRLLCFIYDLTVAGVAAVPRACTVVPHDRAVVPLGSKR